MPAHLTILASGSNGNCAYLETGATRILVDAGLSGRQIRQRLAQIGRTPERLDGILITHEHSDHIQGLAVIAGQLGIPVYCNRDTQEAICASLELKPAKIRFNIFSAGQPFDLGDFTVEAFSVPHDAADPVGFLIHASEACVGFATDLGHATKLVIERIRKAQTLVLETNHDVKLLQEDTRRPWSVKQRILGRHGHLSNDAAADLLQEILHDRLTRLYLGHLSRDCNRPEIAHQTISARLRRMGATHVEVLATQQETPCETIFVGVAATSPEPSAALASG